MMQEVKYIAVDSAKRYVVLCTVKCWCNVLIFIAAIKDKTVTEK